MSALCGAKRRQGGEPCKQVAGAGTDHKGIGRCKFHGGSTKGHRIGAARETAALEAARLGVAIETDPYEALGAIVNIIGGQVAFLQKKVKEIDEGEALTRDALHPTIVALNGVLDQWQRAAKAAADAGVAERAVALDEAVVTRLSVALRAALDEVELSAAQRNELREAMTRRLAELDDLDWRRAPELSA